MTKKARRQTDGSKKKVPRSRRTKQPQPDLRTRRRHAHHERHPSSDNRDAFERDRDRILYSAAFRRLALITQVVSPDEGCDFHNRLTHVLKVAQIGLRLSQKLIRDAAPTLVDELGGLDPSVVEAACLAHDLGHPPFGHITEEILDSTALEHGCIGGFEGNAQTFRVITKLERKYHSLPGLNLTRATLCAVLKYPWTRATEGKGKKKWGAFESESEDFNWAREGLEPKQRTLEAEVMDWADDIAYSVHDTEDFYRGDQIPLHRLRRGGSGDDREFSELLAGAQRRRNLSESEAREWELHAEKLFGVVPVARRYARRGADDIELSFFASFLITKFIDGTRLTEKGLQIDPDVRIQVDLLKELTWQYVIENHALATQQMGQKKIIETLFKEFAHDAHSTNTLFNLFPRRYKDALAVAEQDDQKVRVVIDLIASMTEHQALQMYHRITGVSLGSVFALNL